MRRQTILAAMVVVLVSASARGTSLVYNDQGKVEKVTPKNLRQAAYLGDIEAMKQFIARGDDIDAVNKEGRTPLFYAIQESEHEAAKVLLDKSAKTDIADCNGMTALHVAAMGGDMTAVKLLLNHKASVNIFTPGGATPLRVAVKAGNSEMARLFINSGADLAAEDKIEPSLLCRAAEARLVDIATTLIDRGANVNAMWYKGTPLMGACAGGDANMVILLLNRGANPNLCDWSGISAAKAADVWGEPELSRIILSRGGYMHAPPEPNLPPFMDAAKVPLDWAGRTDGSSAAFAQYAAQTMQAFLDGGGNVNRVDDNGNTLLHFSAHCGLKEMTALLVKSGASVNARDRFGQSPLHLAVRLRDVTLAKRLVEAGADVKSTDENGYTPLHVAAKEGSYSNADMSPAVELLVDNGADINARTLQLETPLLMAARCSDDRLVRLLVKHGADVRLAARDGETPLHAMAPWGKAECVRSLIEHGADISARTIFGKLPIDVAAGDTVLVLTDPKLYPGARVSNAEEAFFKAVRRNDIELTKTLLERGVNINCRNDEGKTGLHVAAAEGLPKVAALLVAKGADIRAKDGEGKTPEDVAKITGNSNVLKLFAVATGQSAPVIDELTARTARRAKERERIEGNSAFYAGMAQLKNPLHKAVLTQDVNKARKLLDAGADVNSRDDLYAVADGCTALHVAIYIDNEDLVKLLIDKGSDVNARDKWGHTLLHKCAEMGRTECAKILVDRGADRSLKNNMGDTPVLWAVNYATDESLNLVNLLMPGSGADEHEILLRSASRQKPNVLRMMLDKGLDANTKGKSSMSLLHIAADSGSVEAARMLVSRGAGINALDDNGRTPLFVAAVGDKYDVWEFLKSKGADPSILDKEGRNPLHGMVTNDMDEVRKRLEMGYDLNLAKKDGSTPIFAFAATKKAELVQLMLDKGASCDGVTTNGCTVLMVSAYNKDLKVPLMILERTKLIDQADNWGSTALHYASSADNSELVKALLAKGASPNTVSRRQGTPLDVAVKNNKPEVAELLKQYGGKTAGELGK